MISFREVGKTFPGPKGAGPVRALDGVDLEIEEGSITGVIGWSGAGKSTLARLVNALALPTEGEVWVRGHHTSSLGERGLRELRGEVGMIFQQFGLLSSRTVTGNVAYPLRIAGWSRERRGPRVTELLEFVGLADKARQYPARLSGGQKQRVGIARALATSPSVLVADEATSALDPETTREVLALLRRVNRELGTTILVITHEMEVVSSLCDRVVVMADGRVIEEGTVHAVFSAPREDATRRFVQGALRDRPGPETVARLRRRFPGRLVTVGVGDDGEQEAVTDALAAHRDVRTVIVYGGISELAERPVGSITYALEGDPAAVDALVADLAAHARVEEPA
ncbi:methionine ABC transporter ATP-binding protein [Actinomycetospora aeridis]|uniref:Methionine ABC transporter ATP-binding protein n=1 Tax=Actinomycetospora aeridis TaxID=3129231 RepID=A0ABU8NBS7_9PSEU